MGSRSPPACLRSGVTVAIDHPAPPPTDAQITGGGGRRRRGLYSVATPEEIGFIKPDRHA